ncbi:hypothetical protein [Massilia rhizosphaerae]|uniref:hypothetical protein n=1 Tax=Massilia rhizosphaerae TaxID=2784389 RepID=UPI0018DE0917|nr:hypothetical protein [Massilia rhizosphaerae]
MSTQRYTPKFKEEQLSRWSSVAIPFQRSRPIGGIGTLFVQVSQGSDANEG